MRIRYIGPRTEVAGNNKPQPWSIFKMSPPRAKRWVFTVNNYTEEHVELYSTLVEENDDVLYLGFGKEEGAQNGTPHLQGLVVLKRRLRRRQLTQLLPHAHVEVMRGSFEQAKEYCQKDGEFEEYGVAPLAGQGQRTDLIALKRSLDENINMRAVADEHFSPFLKYQRGINAYRLLKAPMRNWQPSVIVYWGRTGAGKTRAVMDNLVSPEDCYVHPGGQWFDGYDSHPIVLFDDYGGSEFKLTYLLKLLDRYPMRVPVKGGFVSWVPHEIYITSNRGPLLWYENAHEEHNSAMQRRFTNVVMFQ